ncbi:MAG: hypothetical protein GWP19_12730 [Planctomycetia bacterium]|nr:hypothetical protein [Planctomycetia bacterium]
MKILDSRTVKTRLICVSLFAIAMGLLEAICVVYIRQILFPPDGNIANTPLSDFDFALETIRESMTIIMLTTLSILAAFNWRTRLAMFFLAFGIWDIFYYVGLKIFLDWPTFILDWDTLFLIPVAWYSPILVPVLISTYFIIGSIFIVLHEGNGTTLNFGLTVIILQFLGFIVWFYSFIKDSAMISENGYANVEYSWVLFFLGLLLGVSSLTLSFILDKKT